LIYRTNVVYFLGKFVVVAHLNEIYSSKISNIELKTVYL